MTCIDIQIRPLSEQPAETLTSRSSWTILQKQSIFEKVFREKYLTSEVWRTEIASKRERFSIYPENQTFCSPKLLAAFCPSGYHSLLFHTKKVTFLPKNAFSSLQRKLTGQTSQKLNYILIRLDIQIPFPSSQQLPGFLPSRSQSTGSFLYVLLQYPYLIFSSLFRNFDRPKTSKMLLHVWCFFALELILSTVTDCISSSGHQSTSFGFWIFLKWETLIFSVFSLTENSKTSTCICFFLRFQLISLQNYRLNYIHQGLFGKFYLCIKLLDKHIPKYVARICTSIGWNWQKYDLMWLFWEFSESGSEKYLKFSTLLQNPKKSIISRIAVVKLKFVEKLWKEDSNH